MGALHEGHLSLVRAALAHGDRVVVSIFVNPTQFGPSEDFARYPRTFAADCALLEAEGIEAVFAPAVEEMYPSDPSTGATTFVEVDGLSGRLDGHSRPGHFRGVATVVAKLFAAAEPTRAYFGQKDAAQVAVLRRMVTDLLLPVELIVCPIVREADGLAMSSRNRYLSATERADALVLSRAIQAGQRAFAAGQNAADAICATARLELARSRAVQVDYVALVDWTTLLPVERASAGHLLAVAAWLGTTRLIDNAILDNCILDN
jgi:pantoate--beta-alanine ligase